MHKNKIIHRDLKLGNLFISESMDIKIGDFGLATTIQFDGERKHTICGTPNYIAPEILEGKSVGHSYEVDFWAIGVIIYTLIIGRPPYETEDVKETYKRIQDNKYSFPSHIYISEEGRDLIEKILITNPADRLNLEGIRAHPFMCNVKIPKSMPQYTTNFPPNSIFYRKLNSENIKNISDLSTCNDSNEEHYNNLIKFSKNNLVDVDRKNLLNDEKIFDKMNNINNNQIQQKKNINTSNGTISNNKDAKGVININNAKLNISQTKEGHKLVNNKIKKININNILFINEITDYTNDFGVMYKTNNNLIGIFFNDKTNIFKENSVNINVFYFINKRIKNQKNPQKLNIDNPKDIPTEIKNKFDILRNYQNYLNSEVNKKKKVIFIIRKN
jgi:polo-like kinase 1